MKVAIIGATGRGGKRMIDEALSRGHTVTAISRSAGDAPARDGVTGISCDIADTAGLAKAISGSDAVIATWRPAPGSDDVWGAIKNGFNSLLTAMREAGVKHLLVMGGAGSLEYSPGVLNIDRPDFPEAWKDGSRAGTQQLEMLQDVSDLDWTYLSPAHEIFEGERTGKFRLGGDQLVMDDEGNSRISFEDYAVAMIDEMENPQHTGRRFTLGY
jgi:putative NADH-flavin reductase